MDLIAEIRVRLLNQLNGRGKPAFADETPGADDIGNDINRNHVLLHAGGDGI